MVELIWSKDILPMLEKIQVKYVIVENEIRNNFPYWNFSKFRIEFELNVKRLVGFEIQENFDGI
jgi:hypothetical protein